MSKTAAQNLDDIRISSWAAPTDEDRAILEGLSDADYRELLRREIQKGLDSGVGEVTMDEVWQEAVRRHKAKTPAPDAV